MVEEEKLGAENRSLMNILERARQEELEAESVMLGTFWRVEGSLLNLSAVAPVAFFTWNAQSFLERWARRGGVALSALIRPFLYAANRVFATRVLHTLLRGVSQDRLDFLGEEYFDYVLRPQLKERGVERLKEVMATQGPVVLVSQGLDHVMRPLANFLGAEHLIANRLEFRGGLATGRLLDPVIRPRGALARFTGQNPDGRLSLRQLAKDLGFSKERAVLGGAIIPVKKQPVQKARGLVVFDPRARIKHLSVRESLAGKNILLIGATGFIGKVWLAKVLSDLPEVGKIYLLIRPHRSTGALNRFEKIVEESPVFGALHERYGSTLGEFLSKRVEVIAGDVSRPGLGIEPESRTRLASTLDLIVNSSGLTDFNPDLSDALASNVESVIHILDFLRQCDHAGLMHLSTCYVFGSRDGRVPEELHCNYTPIGLQDFDAEREYQALQALVQEIQARSESGELMAELRRQARVKGAEANDVTEAGLETRIRKCCSRWLHNAMIEAGMERARELGWPNTYTFTKSLAESLIAKLGPELPVAVVRPSIVESSIEDPFRGWNEGVTTSAPISYLMGTYFRQLPSNERKCLDIIPVDLVSRGMTLIAGAIVERRHERVYQLATSARNPCDMRRSIELTSLAHRKYYRAQNGIGQRLRALFEAIPVSKARYQKLSAPGQRAIVRVMQRISSPLPFIRLPLARKERGLDRVEKLIELYEPFILLNQQVFEAENIELLSEALPSEEREAFGYDVAALDWWEYWINIHIPALRRWVYPLIEGRVLETVPRREFRWPSESAVGTQAGDTSEPAAGR